MDNAHLADPGTWLVVLAAGRITRYRRLGRGNPILVLTGDGGLSLPSDLIDRLAARHRLLLPEVLVDRESFVPWLRDFCDGLGLVGAGILVAEAIAPMALEFALIEPGRISRLAIAGAGAPTGWLGTGTGVMPLVVAGEPIAGDGIAALVAYFESSDR